MLTPNYGLADLGLLAIAGAGWLFGVLAAIVARRISYLVWAFWWAALMWWFAVLITPENVTPELFLAVMAAWALALVAWPLRAAYKHLYLAN